MIHELETTDGLVLMNVRDRHAFIMLEQPKPCRCGVMMHFAINRNGRTHCIGCDVMESPYA